MIIEEEIEIGKKKNIESLINNLNELNKYFDSFDILSRNDFGQLNLIDSLTSFRKELGKLNELAKLRVDIDYNSIAEKVDQILKILKVIIDLSSKVRLDIDKGFLIEKYEGIKASLAAFDVRSKSFKLRDNDIDFQFLQLKESLNDIKEKVGFISNLDSEKLNEIIHDVNQKYESISKIERLFRDKFSEVEKQAKDKLLEITENLESQSEKIAETVGRLSTDAVSGRFNSRALEERKSAGKMRWAAIFLMCLAISLVFLSATKLVDYLGWQDLLVRTLATITLFITAGYFANEANKHRRLQHKYERIHLDLSAIDPFIATFDDETQRTLKSEVARRVFVTSHGEDFVKHDAKDDIPTNLAEVMAEMLKVLKTLNNKDG